MSIKTNTRERDGVVIVEVAGRITLGDGAGSLRDLINDFAKSGKKKVLLNLAETSYVDSCGISELVSGFTRLNNQGATLKLLALSPRVEDLLRITKLYTVFDVYTTENEAIASFTA